MRSKHVSIKEVRRNLVYSHSTAQDLNDPHYTIQFTSQNSLCNSTAFVDDSDCLQNGRKQKVRAQTLERSAKHLVDGFWKLNFLVFLSVISILSFRRFLKNCFPSSVGEKTPNKKRATPPLAAIQPLSPPIREDSSPLPPPIPTAQPA